MTLRGQHLDELPKFRHFLNVMHPNYECDKSLNEIDNKIAKGAAWMVSFKLIDRVLGLLSTVILARLLVPSDFGLVAMAMILIAALQLLVSFSFDVPLIQNPDAGRDQFDTAWTFNVVFGMLCALVLALLAHPASQFYREPRLELVVYLLAIGYAIQGFANIGPVVFRREMEFHREFKFLLAKRMAGLVITIPLAFWLRNYWALVIGQLSGAVVSVGLSYVVSIYRPRFSLKAKVELFHSSKWLVINNIFQFLNGRAVEFFIGRLAGVQTLGVYSIASEIATLPTTELVAPINRAAFPGYSRSGSNIDQLRNSFLNVISMIALFALPAGIGIASVAELLVPAVLGWKWLAAIPLIQILAACGVIQALQTNILYVYMALGNLRLLTIVGVAQFIVLITFLVPGIRYWGAVGAAGAFLMTAVIMVPINQILIAKRLKLAAGDFFGKLVRPFIASVFMGLSIWTVKKNLDLQHETISNLLALMTCVAIGFVVYVLAMYVLWAQASKPNGAEQFCFLKMENFLRRVGININLVRC